MGCVFYFRGFEISHNYLKRERSATKKDSGKIMKKNRNMTEKLCCLTAVFFLIMGIGACGKVEEPPIDDENAYLYELKEGVFYVRNNKELSCAPVYLGDTTFERGSTASRATVDRVSWYKEDWENIPTLYKGDDLILYTTNTFGETFIFERYFDLGYTIGLRIPIISQTGRFMMSTNIKDMLTYPNGDTDEINDLKNNIVTFETLGGQQLRAEKIDYTSNEPRFYSLSKGYSATNYLTQYGTFKGLTQNESYEAVFYSGTVPTTYIFKADVRVLGCAEIFTDDTYEFESDRIIVIKIPEWFKSGYYMINGRGFFRYVNDESYDDSTDFNNSNIPSEENEEDFFDLNDPPLEDDEYRESDDEYEDDNSDSSRPAPTTEEVPFVYTCTYYDRFVRDYVTETSELKSAGNSFGIVVPFTGYFKINVSFDGDESAAAEVSAGVETPDGQYYPMANLSGKLEAGLASTTAGTYKVIFYGLKQINPIITMEEVRFE